MTVTRTVKRIVAVTVQFRRNRTRSVRNIFFKTGQKRQKAERKLEIRIMSPEPLEAPVGILNYGYEECWL